MQCRTGVQDADHDAKKYQDVVAILALIPSQIVIPGGKGIYLACSDPQITSTVYGRNTTTFGLGSESRLFRCDGADSGNRPATCIHTLTYTCRELRACSSNCTLSSLSQP